MNTTAVLIGLCYGVISAVVCYVVSMITSGLFARAFYRLYARVLIGICSVMLLAPGLRWLAGTNPQLAAIALTLAQYGVMGVFGYGVFRFNRDYMKRLFLERKTAAYFTFGTLANAVVVTLAFLHVSITGAPSWHESGPGYIGAGHYGPLLVILAAMVFHTDYHLKQSVGDLRRFSRFTFVGYAISFLGLALSTVPYLGSSLHQLGLASIDSPLLQNFFSAQALLIAIVLYAWLVWRYESIPPLFLLLLAIVGEYHVLVTQWVIQSFGPASWGLASLPLFAGLASLDHYFANWDQRKLKSRERAEASLPEAGSSLRFAMPFRFVELGLAIVLLCITLWTRFSEESGGYANWLAATFGIYACFFLGTAFARKDATLVYVSGLLAGLAALLGLESSGGPMSVALLGALASFWCALAFFGERGGLKLPWRTPLADCSLLTAIVATVIVFGRHLVGPNPYLFQAVGFLDALALGFAALAYLVCAHQYRSWLPVFGVLIALATMVPTWSAAIGFLATAAAALTERWAKKENAIALESRVQLFGAIRLPLEDVLPRLYVQPLSMGAIPLAIVGLSISAGHVIQGNLAATVLSGAAVSALVLGLLTRTVQVGWLYVLSLGATYFAVHAIAHRLFFMGMLPSHAFSGHLLVAATLSLFGWTVATVYSAWCGAMLRRVAEAKEGAIRARRSFYVGLLYDVTSAAAGVTLAAVFVVMWLRIEGTAGFLFWAASLTCVLLARAASVYRSQVGSYLSLTALTLAVLNALAIFGLPRWEMAAVIAGMGLSAAAFSCLAWGRQFAGPSSKKEEAATWKQPLPYLEATGIELWLRPLSVYAVVSSVIAVVAVLRIDIAETIAFGLTRTAPLTFALASGAFLSSTRALRTPATYLVGIALAFAASHATAALALGLEEFPGQAQLVHLMLAAGLSLASCCVAAICASAINNRLETADDDRRATLLKNRRYYAGILQHFAFAASCITLLALARSVIFDDLASSNAALMNISVGLLLSATFSLLGAIYHSRIHIYCALAAASFCLHGTVAMLVPDAYRVNCQTLAVSVAALLFGLISWMLVRLERRERPQASRFTQRFQCWENPPLTMVSMDESLWARPLAHVSVFLAFLELVFVGQEWVAHQGPRPEAWLTVTPIYLAAASLFIATKTHRFGWLRPWLVPGSLDQEKRREAADLAERGILFVMSLIACGLAIHLTVHLLALETLPSRMVTSWHLFLGALLALAGWSLATLYAARCGGRLKALPDSDSQEIRRDLELYGGLLQHVSAVAAVLILVGAFTFGVPPQFLSVPLLGSIGLLSLFFGLASFSYRSPISSSICLLAVGLATLHLSSMAAPQWPAVGSLDGLAIALLSLVLVLLASFVTARNESEVAEHRIGFELPSPWSQPNPSSTDLPPSIWRQPLREGAIVYAVAGLMAMIIGSFSGGAWDDAAGSLFSELQQGSTLQTLFALYCVAATFALAARLYGNWIPTYASAIVVALSTVPLLLILGEPIANLGILLALVAVLFWIAGFVVERYYVRIGKPDSERPTPSLSRIYERPLIRCSAVLAMIAITHSLLVWRMYGWLVSQAPLVVACALGALTLMLNAWSLNFLHRVTRARMLVYFGCAAITGCWLAATSVAWSFNGLGPSAAIVSLTLGVIGLLLIESSRAIATSEANGAESRLTYGEPISHFASGLSVLAAVMAIVAVIGSIGLLEVVAEFDSSQLVPAAVTLLMSAAVCLMTVRAQGDVSWLYGAVFLGSVGICLLVESQTGWSLGAMAVGMLILMNLLVACARIIRTHRSRVESLLGLSGANCHRPFFQWPLLFTAVLLVFQVFYLGYDLVGAGFAGLQWPWIWVSLLSGVLFFHVLYLQPHPAYVHLLVGSSVVGILGLRISGGMTLTGDVALCVLGLCWGAVSGLLDRPVGIQTAARLGLPLASSQRKQGGRLLLSWSVGLILLSIAITVPIRIAFSPEFPNVTVTFLLATIAGVVGGFRWRSVHAISVSALLLLVCLASAMDFYGRRDLLLEFSSLIAACLALSYFGIACIAQQHGAREDSDPFFTGVGSSLINVAYALSCGVVIASIASIVQSTPATPVALSMALISICWLWMAWVSDREALGCAAVIGFFFTILYSGNALFGIPFRENPLAAFFVIGYSFVLYGVNILASRSEGSAAKVLIRPTYYMALALPILLVVAIPFGQRTAAAFALLAAGSFYLMIARQSQVRWAMYVAAALVNVAIYLWVPAARELTGLYQLYVIPAAITVLIFAQLHRHELRTQVLTSIRLAAAGAILAVSTFEVFFSEDPSLLQFIAVLLLSLAGITAGIGLRIKPFVFGGIAFLMINVVGQLGLQFQREGGVIRAIILIGVGLVILAAMIFFNIHRERILRQYRAFVVDKSWE